MEKNFVHFKNSLNQIYCSIRYLESNNMITLNWSGTATKDSIEEIKNSLHDLIVANKPVAIINDIQDFFTTPTDILMELTSTEWDAKVQALGIKYIANVLKPDTNINELSITEFPGLEIKFFENKMDAVEWVKQVQGIV